MSRRSRAQKERAARARDTSNTPAAAPPPSQGPPLPAQQTIPFEDTTTAAGALADEPEPAAQNDPESEPESMVTSRAKPVRVTVALHPDEYIALKRFTVEVMASEGLPLVAGAEVLRALLALMRDDPALAARVRAQLAATGGNRRRAQRD